MLLPESTRSAMARCCFVSEDVAIAGMVKLGSDDLPRPAPNLRCCAILAAWARASTSSDEDRYKPGPERPPAPAPEPAPGLLRKLLGDCGGRCRFVGDW